MSERDTTIDAGKGIAILLVLLGHAIADSGRDYSSNAAFVLIYSMHMPLFAYLSGVAARFSTGSIARRAKQLLVPFVAWATLSLLVYPKLILSNWPELFLRPNPEHGMLWFLHAMFVCHVLLWLCEKRGGWRPALALAAGFIVASAIPVISEWTMQVGWLFPFVAAGRYLGRPQSLRSPVFLISAPAWFVTCLYRGAGAYGSIPGAKYAVATLGVLATLALLPRIPMRVIPPLVSIGRASLGIYAMNIPVIAHLSPWIHSVVLVSLAALAITYLATLILGRFSWTARLLLGRWTRAERTETTERPALENAA